jgi:hypothetical protein
MGMIPPPTLENGCYLFAGLILGGLVGVYFEPLKKAMTRRLENWDTRNDLRTAIYIEMARNYEQWLGAVGIAEDVLTKTDFPLEKAVAFFLGHVSDSCYSEAEKTPSQLNLLKDSNTLYHLYADFRGCQAKMREAKGTQGVIVAAGTEGAIAIVKTHLRMTEVTFADRRLDQKLFLIYLPENVRTHIKKATKSQPST